MDLKETELVVVCHVFTHRFFLFDTVLFSFYFPLCRQVLLGWSVFELVLREGCLFELNCEVKEMDVAYDNYSLFDSLIMT